MTMSRNQVLIDTASIAIWNRNKVVVTLSIIVWGISTGFHIRSKPVYLCKQSGISFKLGLVNRCRPGK